MDVKRVLVILALVAMVSSMAGCLGGGDDPGGGSTGAKFTESTSTVTFNEYAGDPEDGSAPSKVTFTIPASAAPGDGDNSSDGSPDGFRRADFSVEYNSADNTASMEGGSLDMETRIYQVNAVLTWVDGDGADSDPDVFSLTLTCGDESTSQEGEGDSSAGGEISLSVGMNETKDSGDYLDETATIEVECIECGFTASTKNWGLIHLGTNDAGNDFILRVEYSAWVR